MRSGEELVMAYIAGLIDGDGSISLIREKRASGFKYYPCIQLSNVFEDMVSFLYQTFGGCKKIKSRQFHCKKDQFVWNVRGLDSCKNVLEKILPYLVLKQKQGQRLLKFVKLPESCNPEVERLEIQSLNNDSHVCDGNVVKQAKKNTESPFFWAYFAGIMDTEGSFSVRRESPSAGRKNYRYTPMIQLSMASFESMNFIRENFCYGHVCFPKASSTQRGFTYKIMVIKASQCVEMVNSILPYLRFKRSQAIELVNFCLNYKPVKYRQKGISENEIIFRESCYQKIKKLNEGEVYKSSLIDSETRWGNEGQA